MSAAGAARRISVVVPAHRGGEDLFRCLESLKRASPAPLEIIVVSDGDDAEAQRLARQAGLSLVGSPRRAGPASARNLGARAARGDVLLFVDSDVVVPVDGVGQVAELLGRHEGVAALFGSYDSTPAAGSFLSQYRNLLHHYTHQTGQSEASTFWGAFGAIRREAFFAVGGFDERRYREPSIEDIELGCRLKRAGYRIRLCHALQVQHRKRWSLSSLLHTDIFRRAMPWTELLLRTGAWMDDLNLRKAGRVSVLLALGLVLSLVGACRWPQALVPAALQGVGLLVLNTGLYGFFLRQRGVLFMLSAIPWHWLYFVCGGLGFASGVFRHLLLRGQGPAERPGPEEAPQAAPELTPTSSSYT